MKYCDWQPADDKLLARYSSIVDSHANGFADSILWRGAFRQLPWAMLELARNVIDRGAPSDSFSAPGLARRGYRLGDPAAAYNLAMVAFNRRDLTGYRYWLNKAAQAGDDDAERQLRRFETRLPHTHAPKGRKRPYRRGE